MEVRSRLSVGRLRLDHSAGAHLASCLFAMLGKVCCADGVVHTSMYVIAAGMAKAPFSLPAVGDYLYNSPLTNPAKHVMDSRTG